MNCQIIYSKMIFRSFNSGHCWHCTQFCSDLNQIAQFPVNIMSFHQNEFARKWVGADNREILIVVFSWFLMFFFVPTYLDDFFRRIEYSTRAIQTTDSTAKSKFSTIISHRRYSFFFFFIVMRKAQSKQLQYQKINDMRRTND